MSRNIDPIVETRHGKLRGRSVDGVHIFKGIRYAVADRFMPPRPPEPWAGVVDALEFGAIAPQTDPAPPPGPPPVILAHLPRPAGSAPPPPPPESEDCLFLNVWAPSSPGRRAVMVWLHGGFFHSGSGNGVDGSELARKRDVVVVSLNHRLNVFGFCHLADIAGADYAHSGNAGMLDIIAALEWVRDHIALFGGDPQRVMVFGTSGGGMKTSFLMGSPRARGLLHRAGIQSGPGLRFMERDAASAVTERLLAELKLDRSEVGTLRTIEPRRLLAAAHSVARQLRPARFIDLPTFGPVIDPQLLPRHPFSPGAAPDVAPIPVLTGWTSHEMTFFMGNDPQGFALDDEGLRSRLAKLFGERAAEAEALYRREFPSASPSELYIQAYSDLSLMLPVTAHAERLADRAGAGTWMYRLDLRSPALGGRLGAVHTLETPLIFDTAATNPLTAGSEAAGQLALLMSTAWTRFAQTGVPSADGLPEWPQYERASRNVMILDTQPRVDSDPGRQRLQWLAPWLGV